MSRAEIEGAKRLYTNSPASASNGAPPSTEQGATGEPVRRANATAVPASFPCPANPKVLQAERIACNGEPDAGGQIERFVARRLVAKLREEAA